MIDSDKNPRELVLAKQFLKEGKFVEALQFANSFEEKGELQLQDQLECHLLKSVILLQINNFNEALKFAEKAYQESQELGKHLQSVDALILKAKSLSNMMRLNDSLDAVMQAENLLKNVGKGPNKKLTKRKASIAIIKARSHMYKGDSDSALLYGKESLRLREDIDDKKGIIESLMAIGWVFSIFKGEIDQALIYAERCFAIAEEINDKSCRGIVARNLQNLGVIYTLKGDLDRALMYYERGQPIFEELNDKFFSAGCLGNIAEIYKIKGEIDRALVCYEKALVLQEEIGNSFLMSSTLLNLIAISLEMEDLEQAKQCLQRLERLNDQEENRIVNTAYKMGKALVFKMSSRTRNRAKAEEILKQVIEERTSIGTTTSALLLLCDLLLFELQMTNDLEVLDEIQSYITQLLDIAEKYRSYEFIVEIYLLQARLSLLTLDIKNSRRFLTQAQQIAERHGFNLLKMKVSSEHEELLKKISAWEKLKEIKAPLSERIELSQLGEQMTSVLRNSAILTTQITEDKVIIHREKKICIVCKGEVLGFMYVCKCDVIYCENCVRALTDLENACWACNAPMDNSKPVKRYGEEEISEITQKKLK